jgi:steroid 5-alpha reductase family enzyme
MIILYVACLVIALGTMLCAYGISLLTRLFRVVDIFWGLSFIILSLFCLKAAGLYLPRQLLVTVLIALWGLRLSGYLVVRSWGKGEDPRYAAFAAQWGSWIYVRYFVLFLFQGVLVWLISFSMIAIMSDATAGSFGYFDFFAVLLWCIGFAYEVIGDWQLQRFLRDPSQKGTIMDRGLWRFTRHPNYFGEIVMWWSIWLLALPVGSMGVTLISPLTITGIILYFSLPLTERQLSVNHLYVDYKERTSALIPWYPKKAS